MPCDVRRIGEIAIFSHGPLFMVAYLSLNGRAPHIGLY